MKKKSALKMVFPAWTLAPMLASMMAFAAPPPRPPQSDGGQKTADDQRNSKEDLALAASIRRALMADKTLSVSAHNVKIITQNGIVTLRGSVKSDAEKEAIAAKAREIAGATMVIDSLSVSPSKTN